jgi:hypothetical protein
MEQSDFLELNILGNNDYAKHWDVPVNENFTDIDAECEEIATELLTDPTTPYSGKLRGSAASLQARLNVAMDANGNILYNDYDLEKSRYSRKPWTVPSNMSDRISKLEEDSYVEDRLKASLATDGFAAHYYIRESDDRLGGPLRQDRRFSVNGVDLKSVHYRTCTEADFTVSRIGGFRNVVVPATGFMQINGNLFNHTLPFTVGYSNANDFMILWARPSINPAMAAVMIQCDCQDVRKSTSLGMTTGTCIQGGSTFTSAGIGAATVGINNWMPSLGQILRIFDGAAYRDYTISTVAANSVDIHGKFEFGDGATPYTWGVFDFSQPVFYVNYMPGVTNESIMTYTLHPSFSTYGIPLAFVTSNATHDRVSFPTFYQGAFSKYKLLSTTDGITFDSAGYLGGMGGGATSFAIAELTDISAASIKAIHVIVLEKYLLGGISTTPRYYLSIDPVREIPGIVPIHYAHSYQTYIAQGSTGTAMIRVSSPGSAGMTTNIAIEHPDYNDDGGSASYWTSLGAATDKTLEYLGILVELL